MQTKAPSKTPSPHPGVSSKSTVGKSHSPSRTFVGMALDMSWRLAVVVLVPIIGGFKLDEHWQTTPLLTIVGFILAMSGMALVMWRTVQVVNKLPLPPKQEKRA